MQTVYNEIMKLRIYNINNRYAFTVDGFSSLHHAYLVPGIQSSYKFAWQAHKKAKLLAFKKPLHVDMFDNKYAIEDLSKPIRSDIPAEDILINHYKHILVEMSRKVNGIDDNTTEEKQMTYLMIKSQVEDLLRIKDTLEDNKYKIEVDRLINQYRKIVQSHFKAYLEKDRENEEAVEALPPQEPMEGGQQPPPLPMEEGQPTDPNLTMASKKKLVLTRNELSELLEHYGEKTCIAISHNHPDAICKVSVEDMSLNILGIDRDKDATILKINFNENMHANNIIPVDGLSETYPSFSSKFYQRYWKPIVEAIGHFSLDELDSIIFPSMSALPDMKANGGECDFIGWNPRELKENILTLIGAFATKT